MAGGIIGVLTDVDAAGNEQELYPVTVIAAVGGLEEALETIRSDSDNNLAELREEVDNSLVELKSVITSTTATCTVSSSGWSGGKQTVSVPGVTATNNIIVTPAPASYADAMEYGVYCSAQGNGTLTFAFIKQPTKTLTMNVLFVK